MDAVIVLRSTFILMASTVAVADALPGIRSRFILYGPRNHSSSAKSASIPKTSSPSTDDGLVGKLLNIASKICVPHTWFTHFYILSLFLSGFWAFEIATHGPAFSFIAAHASSAKVRSMTFHQVLLTWSIMFVQGARRFYESFELLSASASRMWIAHWAAGLVFYACMSVAVWIEGSPAISSSQITVQHLYLLAAPSLKSFIAIPIFLIASGIQYDCHSYLASLQKYSLPVHPIFQLVICPHYFAECLIYLSLAIVAAPPASLVNGTVACALVFVVVNLGVTAKNTRRWYADKFGEDKVKDRWNMIPYIW